MTFASDIEKRINNQISKNLVCVPAIILKVYDDLHVDVQPKQMGISPLRRIPVMILKFGSASIMGRPEIGDIALLIISRFSISKLISTNGISNTQSKHSLEGAVCICGFHMGTDNVTFPPSSDAMYVSGPFQLFSVTAAEEATMIGGWGVAEAGRIWYNSTVNKARAWDGAVVRDMW